MSDIQGLLAPSLPYLVPLHVEIHNYRPQRSLGQGYVFTRVCDSVHRRGVCLSACWDTISPQARQTPWQEDPPGKGDNPPGKADPPGTVHAGRYGEQAGSMHPTGMQFRPFAKDF